MRKSWVIICALLFVPHSMAVGADSQGADLTAAEARGAGEPVSFNLRITEFSLQSPPGHQASNEQILKLLTDSKDKHGVSQLETLRLSALEGREAMVQFGRRASITTGRVSNGRGGLVQRQTQFIEVGTIVRVEGKIRGDRCELELSYEASRLRGENTEDSPPDIVTSQLSGSYVAKIGQPVLLGGTDSGSTSFLVLTVER
ncbi:MAG: hypothetical protein MI861_27710 [Pirellulales bacterium]|nr:hypothetical protein [Pirellulales bacterium]